MTGDVVRFPTLTVKTSPGVAAEIAEKFLEEGSPALSEDVTRSLDDSEVLLAVCRGLDQRILSAPAAVGEYADFVYSLLNRGALSGKNLLFDEREYYLGEFAFLAGCAYRLISNRELARNRFDRAELWFLSTTNAISDIARIGYQRLALKMEERQYQEILDGTPALIQVFETNKSAEWLLKCRSLQAGALKEMGHLQEALRVYEQLAREALELNIGERLLGSINVNRVQLHSALGEADQALKLARDIIPSLQVQNNRTDIAKLQWGLANLLRCQGRLLEAVAAFRESQREFREIGMAADAAALHLVIGDLLLELGYEAQAEWEIRAALPVIDELKMVPEGVAALSLLRESVRRRKIDRQALRDLHGYFDEIQG